MRRTAQANLRARNGERGFALLIVFLLAAAVALALYRQIPRVAFESQRDKEELLIEHGEQYKRGIQLYYVAFKKYPAKIEDLENTNNKRFLRRRFIDPMTGKDEWRLIHVNAAGVLTDSLVQKPPTAGQPGSTATGPSGATGAGGTTGGPNSGTTFSTNNGFGTNNSTPSSATGTNNGAGTGSGNNNGNDPNRPPEVNATVYRRPSDRPLVPANGIAQNTNVDPNDPRYWPPITLAQPSGPSGAPGVAQPGVQQPGMQPNGALPGQPGVAQGFQPGQTSGVQQFAAQPFGMQTSGVQPAGFQPGVPSGLQGGLPTGTTAQGFIPQFPGQQFPGQQYPGQANPALQNSGQNLPGQITGAMLGQPGVTPPDPSAGNSQYPNPIPSGPAYPSPGFPTQTPGLPTQVQGFPGQTIPGQFNAQPGAQPGQAGSQGTGAPGVPGNTALAAINNLLTTPRQTPAPTTDASGSMNAGGLAGVASTFKAASIKVYKDQHRYNQWEFIFDLKTGLPGQQPAGAPPPGQNAQGQGAPGQSAPGQSTGGQGTGGQNSGQSGSTFGSSNTFAPSTTFGSASGTSTTAPPQ